MKKCIFILISLILSASTHAQRLNDLGLKMVKEFTIRNFNSDGLVNYVTRYVYDYDKKDRMISLTKYDKDNKRISEYTNDGDKITYDNFLCEHCKYSFKQDRYGNITSFEFIELDYEDLNTPCWKTEYIFSYAFENGVLFLSNFISNGYSYSPKEKKFYKNQTNINEDIIYNDGIYTKTGVSVYVTDYDHPNDTNLSFYMIFDISSIGYNDLYTNDLMNTEWINMHRPYFAKNKFGTKENEFHYDSNGNIIKIDIYENYGRKRLVKELEIKYVD